MRTPGHTVQGVPAEGVEQLLHAMGKGGLSRAGRPDDQLGVGHAAGDLATPQRARLYLLGCAGRCRPVHACRGSAGDLPMTCRRSARRLRAIWTRAARNVPSAHPPSTAHDQSSSGRACNPKVHTGCANCRHDKSFFHWPWLQGGARRFHCGAPLCRRSRAARAMEAALPVRAPRGGPAEGPIFLLRLNDALSKELLAAAGGSAPPQVALKVAAGAQPPRYVRPPPPPPQQRRL